MLEKKNTFNCQSKNIDDLTCGMFQEYDKYVIASRTDPKGIITYVSSAFADISGYTKEEMIGKPHNIVRHPEIPKEVFENMWKKLKNNQIWTGELKNRKKDGSYYWVKATISPYCDENGHFVGYSSIREDITAKKELNSLHEDLEAIVVQEISKNIEKDKLLAQQAKLAALGEMMDAIAHQWKQPLSAISLTIQKLELDSMMDRNITIKDIEQLAQKSQNQISHLVSTIDDFREFFRPNKELVSKNIKKMIESVQLLLKDNLMLNNIQIEVLGNDNIKIDCIPNEFKHIFINLINNSKDAFIENNITKRKITFDIAESNSNVVLKITDNAGGISHNIIDNIFTSNFTTKQEGKGTGIGLYLVKQIIEKLNSTIVAENIDDGVCFSITIPKKG